MTSLAIVIPIRRMMMTKGSFIMNKPPLADDDGPYRHQHPGLGPDESLFKPTPMALGTCSEVSSHGILARGRDPGKVPGAMSRKKSTQGDLASVQEPAPGDLRIVHAFVNTMDRRMGTEELTSPRALGAWLASQGLPGTAATLTEADLRKAIEMREGLRALLAANSGFALDERAVTRLGKLAACRGAFYDYSKNRSGQWCTRRRCGNQLAAKKYRRSDWYRYLHSDED